MICVPTGADSSSWAIALSHSLINVSTRAISFVGHVCMCLGIPPPLSIVHVKTWLKTTTTTTKKFFSCLLYQPCQVYLPRLFRALMRLLEKRLCSLLSLNSQSPRSSCRSITLQICVLKSATKISRSRVLH